MLLNWFAACHNQPTKNDHCHEQLRPLLHSNGCGEREKKHTQLFAFRTVSAPDFNWPVGNGSNYTMHTFHENCAPVHIKSVWMEHKTPTRGRDNKARVRMKCGFRFVEAVSFHPPAFKPHPGHEIWFSRANDVQTSYDRGPGTLKLRTLFGSFIQLLWCYIIINIPIFYCKEENFIYKGAVLVQFSFSFGK